MQRAIYRLLVLDPSPGLATGLAALLDQTEGLWAEGRVMESRLEGLPALTGAEAERFQPDALMLDPGAFSLPPQTLIRSLRDCFGRVRLVGYVADDDPQLARTCLALGFSAFLSKSATLDTIRLCLSAVRTGALFVEAPHIRAVQTGPDAPAPLRGLTERETYVLKSVARGKSLKEIGYELALSSKTVETYKARGTSKLNISGRREIVEYAIRAGWV